MRILLHCNADLFRACPRQLKILVGHLLLPQRGERPVKLRLGKYADAFFRISLAACNSLTSRSSSLILASSALLRPYQILTANSSDSSSIPHVLKSR